MKKLFSVLLCVCMLASLCVTGVGADTAPLSVTVSYGATNGADFLGEPIALNAEGAVTIDSSTGLPYQLFEIQVGGVQADRITMTLDAATIENERLALKAYNVTTKSWDTLSTAVSNGIISGTVDLATYAENDVVKAMATVDYVSNGSNRIIWSTDQQHYTKHDDLNYMYYGIHEYMVEEYQAGNLGYVINTGDIVDDMPSMTGAKGQWIIADKAFDILDEADVPYGIVTGNHDVGDYPANVYTHYLNHFNEERYADRPWYGGTEDNNRCHYDLVTVGNVDFLMLYIGYGVEDQKSVLDWADKVLDMYPHRSAIICTHQYLKPTSMKRAGRGDILHNTLVTTHDNVVMVLSGHYDGAAYVTQELEDGRIVQEVIADYQFVQKESEEYYKDHKDPTHSIGSVYGCNGEGYIREVIVEGNTVSMYAFSPITGGTTPFGMRDDITLEVPFKKATRQITVYGFAVAEGEAAPEPPITNDADPVVYYADKAALQTLIDEASALTLETYTDESFAALAETLGTACDALNGSDEDIANAYSALAIAKGALVEWEFKMDPQYLTVVHEFDMNLESWQNGDGPSSLQKTTSYIKAEQLEDGGFTAEKGVRAPNDWPQIKYTDPITFTPEGGKIYLYLDLEAESMWSCYPMITQNGKMISVDKTRLNYAIEGSFKSSLDAGGGKYKGVYDVTQAFEDMGIDLNEELTISFAINVVPGPVTFRALSILTGEYTGPTTRDLGGEAPWLLIVLIGGAVIVVAALVIVVMVMLEKSKKK